MEKTSNVCNKCCKEDAGALISCAVCSQLFHVKCVAQNLEVCSELIANESFNCYCEEHTNLCVHKLLNRTSCLENKVRTCVDVESDNQNDVVNNSADALCTEINEQGSLKRHKSTQTLTSIKTDNENFTESGNPQKNWCYLESHLLYHVFDYFSFEELKTISLVCHNWYDEIAFMWRDTLKLDFEYLLNDRNSSQSNIEVLKNSKRIYSNLKIECKQYDKTYFENIESAFKAIPLKMNFKSKYIKSLELKDLSLKQVEHIFKWMGESLEKLSVSSIYTTNERSLNTFEIDSQYFKIFSNLKELSIIESAAEFQQFFKYFVNVRDLSLKGVTPYIFEEVLGCCTNVRSIHLEDIGEDEVFACNIFDSLQCLKYIEEIFVHENNSQTFIDMFVEIICDPDIKHKFPLKVFHFHEYFSEENIKNVIWKFPNLEDILIFNENPTIFQTIWNTKHIKAIRGDICNIDCLKSLPSMDFSPRLALTIINIHGNYHEVIDCNIIKQVLQCLPNLNTLYLKYVYGDISLIFEQLSLLDNLKTLTLLRVMDSKTEKTKVYCLKALEHLEIYNHYNYEDYPLDLPNLKTFVLLNRSYISEPSFISIITTSKNLEHIEIKNESNFKTSNSYLSQIMNLPHLQSLNLGYGEDGFECVKLFLCSPHKIPFINVKLTISQTKINQKLIDNKIAEISKFADKFSILLDEDKEEYKCMFYKEAFKVQLHYIFSAR